MGKMNAISEELLDYYEDDLLEMGYKAEAPITLLKLPATYLTPEN